MRFLRATGGTGESDAGTADCANAPAVGPSCATLADTCGPNMDESCCAVRCVRGGTFALGRKACDPDDDACSGAFSCDSDEAPSVTATVRPFWLDRFEVTVGRFRKFVAAGMPEPATGAGKHGYLNGGTESGWDGSWSVQTAASLLCEALYQTWTTSEGANENKAMNCLDWYTAYAFCIWDGGFLPTEAEWELAASGGEERVFPWSDPAGTTTIDSTYAMYSPNCICGIECRCAVAVVGSKSPKGDGKWGHADMAGNLHEWVLDWYAAPYPLSPCDDCANFTPTRSIVLRGGALGGTASGVRAAFRFYGAPSSAGYGARGVRCARTD